MGSATFKLGKPNENVVNNVKIIEHTTEINSLWVFTIILKIIAPINHLLKIYFLHKILLRKKYASGASDLEKI